MHPADNECNSSSTWNAALLGSGAMCVSAAALFYRQKRTRPFKVAYALSWPIVGAALLVNFGPKREDAEKYVRSHSLHERRKEAAQTMEVLKGIAEK